MVGTTFMLALVQGVLLRPFACLRPAPVDRRLKGTALVGGRTLPVRQDRDRVGRQASRLLHSVWNRSAAAGDDRDLCSRCRVYPAAGSRDRHSGGARCDGCERSHARARRGDVARSSGSGCWVAGTLGVGRLLCLCSSALLLSIPRRCSGPRCCSLLRRSSRRTSRCAGRHGSIRRRCSGASDALTHLGTFAGREIQRLTYSRGRLAPV